MNFFRTISLLFLGFLYLVIQGCEEETVIAERENQMDSFILNYNNYIAKWLDAQAESNKKTIGELEQKIAAAVTEAEKLALRTQLETANKAKQKIAFRKRLGDYFSFKKLDDLPKDLVWENGMDNPEIGDPKAKKGGVFRSFIQSFPPTLRPIGPNSNHSSRGYMYDEINMATVARHPITNKFYPSLAKEWAVSKDGKTVYYRIDPLAKFSDGEEVLAEDFLCSLYIRLSDNVFAPFPKQYYREELAQITVFDERTIAVTLPVAKLDMPYFAGLSAAPLHFYDEYGPDYKERYQWRYPPTTGAYQLLDKDIKKGRSFTMSRVKNWWAKDKKFFRYTNNVDRILYKVVGERSKAFELFKLGQIDSFLLGQPEYWYDKMETKEYFNGYITKAKFYNIYPRVPRGFYFNVAKPPVDNKDVRIGFSHALDIGKVNTIINRADGFRLEQFSDGFDEFTDPSIKARRYSIELAEAAFAKAGYEKRDDDGFLFNSERQRLKLEITFDEGNSTTKKMMALLKEGAKKAGVEIILDGQQSNQYFKKVVEKRHKVCYIGWGVSPPFPSYYQFFHSSNARDAEGELKQQTNNINSFENERMDALSRIVRDARSRESLKKAAWEAQGIIHDEAIFVPALKTPYIRLAYWNWLKWPDTAHYKFSSPKVYIPRESYLYWIDEDEKKSLMESKQKGEKFPEKNRVFDFYKNGLPSLEELDKNGGLQ